MSPPRVLFVCTGNICRSPAAHAVLVSAARRAGVPVVVDSAGLGGWHAGELPDPRAIAEGAGRGYVLDHPARKVRPTDFAAFDRILAMDRTHLRGLAALAPTPVDHLVLFRTFDPTPGAPDVADPYYDGPAAFVEMFDVIEAAMPRLLARVGEIGGRVTRPSTF